MKLLTDRNYVKIAEIRFYNNNGTQIQSNTGGIIYPNSNFRIILARADDDTLPLSFDILKYVYITPIVNNEILFVQATNSNPGLNYIKTRMITGEIQFAEKDILFYLDDFSVYGLQYYTYASSSFTENGTYHALSFAPILIPKGSYYRLSVGKKENAEMEYEEALAQTKLIKYVFIEDSYDYPNFENSLRNELALIKQRINLLENEQLPSYYEDSNYSISNKCSSIINLNTKIKPEILQFAFITDMHLYTGNSKNSRALLNYIIKNTNVDTIINGGDLIDDHTTDLNYDDQTSFGYLKILEEANNYAVPDGCKNFFFIPGNHDAGAGWNPTTDAKLDTPTFVKNSLICRSSSNVIFNEDGLQYYIDDHYHKIRYIICSIGNSINFGNWDSSKSHGVAGMSDADCLVFINNALNTTPTGWNILVFNHILINNWPNKGALVLENACDIYNENHPNSKIIAIIGGHSHVDWSYQTTGGINCIMTTTDNRSQQCKISEDGQSSIWAGDVAARPNGTYKEQAFDIFTINKTNKTIQTTRIGWGQDRNWTYN